MTTPEDRDVDARFLLANERTLLAWQRTALALIAGGVATSQLSTVSGHDLLAVVLCLIGCGVAAAGGIRYRAADRALRQGRLPAVGRAPMAVVLVVVTVGLAAAVAAATGR